MDTYKKMYLKLFNEITDTIEHLKKLQAECEEMYILAKDEDEQ